MKPVPLGPFLGINNRLPDHQLAVLNRGRKAGDYLRKAGDYLRNAVNVDLTASGTVQRRQGATKVLAGADLHSLWSERDMTLYVDGDALRRVGADFEPVTLRDGLVPGQPASYTWFGHDVYWTNGVVLERIRGGVCGPAGVPVLNPAPFVLPASGGSLPGGLYQVVFTAVGADGEESGASWPTQVLVPPAGRLDVMGLPGTSTNIYVSPVNGDELFLTAQTSATTYSIPVGPGQGARCPTLGLRPMPAGQIVRAHNGRLLVARDSILYYSEPFAPALHNPARGYVPFPGRITVVEPTDGGVYVVADRTYWLAGDDIDKAGVVEKLPYGAVEGTGGRSPTDQSVWWYSARGLVVGTPAGDLKNLQEETVAVESAAAGATLFRESDGMRQLVASLRGAESSRAAATSYMDAEVIRKESML